MKLLVVDLQNPANTQYRNPKDIGTFLLGRHIPNYPMFAVDDAGNTKPIVLTSSDCIQITKEVMEQLKEKKTYVRKFVIEVEVTESLKDAQLYEIEENHKAGWYDPEFDSGVIRYDLREVT